MSRRALIALCVVVFAHAGFYIWYQWPDRDVAWTDQGGYRQLGAVLARTGEFTRYPDAEPFVPEVIRTPGYPAFVALVYRVAGVGNDLAVLAAQAIVLLVISLCVYWIARRAMREPLARAAAFATGLFPPLAYFGALVMTELLTALAITAAMLICLAAVRSRRIGMFVAAGVLFTAATMVRPAFVLLPFFLAIGMPVLVRAHRTRPYLLGWGALALSAALALLPWFTYNYVYLGAFTLSPAGGVGRGLWEGSWQGHWPGRVQAELTSTASEAISRDELHRRVRDIAARHQLDAAEMLVYVDEWRDIREIWDSPKEPAARVTARVVADQEYLRAALAHIRAEPVQHAMRRLTNGLFVLWAADVPIRFTDINDTPTWMIRAIWAGQVLLILLAAIGILALATHGQFAYAAILALAFVYVSGVHVPLLCEARQSLPVKPLVIVAAVAGFAALRGRLLPLEPQVHERQHV